MDKPKLYFKNEKGRYQEYREPVADRDDAFYIKRNGEFVPMGTTSRTFDELYEGVWIVMRHEHSVERVRGEYAQKLYNIWRASDIKDPTLSELGGYLQLVNHLCTHFKEIKGNSIYEQCACIVSILMGYDEEKKKRLNDGNV